MRYFTDFLAFVDTKDFEKAIAGDVEAKRRIAKSLDGIDLYFHGFNPGPGDWVGVTLADLLCHGIIPRVTLRADE